MTLLRTLWQDTRRLKWLLTALLLLSGIVLGWNTRGVIALDWQRMYRPEEFQSLGDLGDFLASLQTGISPIWSSLEILSQLILGTTAPFSRLVYPLALIAGSVLPLWAFSKSSWQALLTAGLSLLFMVVTRILHQGNPQLYDLYFPMLFLGFIVLVLRMKHPNVTPKQQMWLAFGAGMLLTTLELTRTFAIALMPLLVLGAWMALRNQPRRNTILFLLPLVVLGGGWHTKQMVMHGQFHWTNHSGFNLQKSWVEFTGPIAFEEDPPRYTGGFANFNTDRHTENNKAVTQKVLSAIAAQPGKAVGHTARRTLAFFRPRTDLYLASLPKPVEWVYRPVVWLLGTLLLLLTLRLGGMLLRRPHKKANWKRMVEPGNMLVLGVAASSLLFSIGESGEEARFMISILPLLACLPAILLQEMGNRD